MNDSFIPAGLETPQEDLDALAKLVIDCRSEGQPNTMVIEVGSWVGRTARTMADAGALVWCVDTFQGSIGDSVDDTERMVKQAGGPEIIFQCFCKNAGLRLFKRIFPCVGSSEMWAKVWPYQVDLVFIDADHRYEAVKADIEYWLPKVRKGGVICGHDYGTFDGVKRATNEIFGPVNILGRTLWAVNVE